MYPSGQGVLEIRSPPPLPPPPNLSSIFGFTVNQSCTRDLQEAPVPGSVSSTSQGIGLISREIAPPPWPVSHGCKQWGWWGLEHGFGCLASMHCGLGRPLRFAQPLWPCSLLYTYPRQSLPSSVATYLPHQTLMPCEK